jgi:hypothetical protein
MMPLFIGTQWVSQYTHPNANCASSAGLLFNVILLGVALLPSVCDTVSDIFEVVTLWFHYIDHYMIIRKLVDSICSNAVKAKTTVNQILLNAWDSPSIFLENVTGSTVLHAISFYNTFWSLFPLEVSLTSHYMVRPMWSLSGILKLLFDGKLFVLPFS